MASKQFTIPYGVPPLTPAETKLRDQMNAGRAPWVDPSNAGKPWSSETALAELTDGLSLRDLRFTLVRVGIADIDAVGVEGNGFALKLAALPWRLVLMVLSDKQDAAAMRQMTEDQVAAVRA